MILKNSIGVSYMWNKNINSMMSMLGIVINAHKRVKTTNIDYEQLGIEQIDNGSSGLRNTPKRRKVSNRKKKE
jgi:hypothetical protein